MKKPKWYKPVSKLAFHLFNEAGESACGYYQLNGKEMAVKPGSRWKRCRKCQWIERWIMNKTREDRAGGLL